MKTIHKQNEFNRYINHKKDSIINSRAEEYNCTERKKNKLPTVFDMPKIPY